MSRPRFESESGFTLIELLVVIGIIALVAVAFGGGFAAAGTDPVPSLSFIAFPPPLQTDGTQTCIGDSAGADFTVQASATHPDLGTVNLPQQTVKFKILPNNINVATAPSSLQARTDQTGKTTLHVTALSASPDLIHVEATLSLPKDTITAPKVGPYEVDPDCD